VKMRCHGEQPFDSAALRSGQAPRRSQLANLAWGPGDCLAALTMPVPPFRCGSVRDTGGEYVTLARAHVGAVSRIHESFFPLSRGTRSPATDQKTPGAADNPDRGRLYRAPPGSSRTALRPIVYAFAGGGPYGSMMTVERRTLRIGQCTPFVTLDAAPFGLTFPPDGQSMLVSVSRGGVADMGKGGAIVRVSPDGKVEEKPLVTAPSALTGMDFAPAGFGAYAGQLFVAELGSMQFPVPMTQTLSADGKLHRVTPEGQLQLVASGFINPLGLRFVGQSLWVTDVNGDFIGGMRELPDGFIVAIAAR